MFYHDDTQKKIALAYKKQLSEAKLFDDPIVTEITALTQFYPAENYHQNYYNLNEGRNPYCSYVVRLKVDKFQSIFPEKIKY